MSYANPSTNVGVVNYSVVGDNINKSLTNIETAREEIVTQQKEAQAILDEKFETISDALATKNIMIFGGEVSDVLAQGFRELADKEGLYNLSSQGFRDLKAKAETMKSSVDKIAELSSSNVELSKQFDDPALASMIGAVRDGDRDSVSVTFEDGRIMYTHEYNGIKKTWSDEDIVRESSKFEDVGIKREKYNSFLDSAAKATQANIKDFAKEGSTYENTDKDINSAFKALSLSDLTYLYNEEVADNLKSGLPAKYNSYTDKNGNKLSIKEVAANRIEQDKLAKAVFERSYLDKVSQYPIAAKEETYAQKKAVDLQYAKDLADYQNKIKGIDKDEMIPDSDLFERISNLSKNTSGVEVETDMEYNLGLRFSLDRPIIGLNPSKVGTTINKDEISKFVSESKLIGEPILSGDGYSIISDIEPTSDGSKLDIYGEVSYEDTDGKSKTKREIISTIPLGGEGNLYPLIVAGRAKAGTSRIKNPTEKKSNSTKENVLSRLEWLKTVPKGGDTSTKAYMNYRNSFNK